MSEQHYQLLDSGNFRKLEQVGPFRMVRPAAQAVWRPRLDERTWKKVDAEFHRSSGGGGKWSVHNPKLERPWLATYAGAKLWIKLTDFGHIGLFAEHDGIWREVRKLTEAMVGRGPTQILNLFAYTGASTISLLRLGASVVHLDASKASIQWAKDNLQLNELQEAPVRWLLDDVRKFVAREGRREAKYQGIILDPPSFGRGPNGEIWNVEEHLPDLLDALALLRAKDFGFLLLTCHSPGYTPLALRNLVEGSAFAGASMSFELGEMMVESTASKSASLPSGAFILVRAKDL